MVVHIYYFYTTIRRNGKGRMSGFCSLLVKKRCGRLIVSLDIYGVFRLGQGNFFLICAGIFFFIFTLFFFKLLVFVFFVSHIFIFWFSILFQVFFLFILLYFLRSSINEFSFWNLSFLLFLDIIHKFSPKCAHWREPCCFSPKRTTWLVIFIYKNS